MKRFGFLNPLKPSHRADFYLGGGYNRGIEPDSGLFSLKKFFTPEIKNKKSAFTLAEVLITIGVIGIVAALTIPNLITKYQKKVTATKLKKFYSEIQNVIKASGDENGEPETWIHPTKYGETDEMESYIKTYWMPYFKNSSYYNSGYFRTRKYIMRNYRGGTVLDLPGIVLSDERIIRFFSNGTHYLWIFMDINGFKGPNRVGRDIFVLNHTNASSVKPWYYTSNSDQYGCSKECDSRYCGFYCLHDIMINNWTIPDSSDYPW